MIRKIALAGATAVALTLGGAGIASASLAPQYQVNAKGTAGYYDVAGLSVHDIGATITGNPAALNIGGVGTGGIGTQLCDPNNGFALQLGETSNGSTMSVEYQDGVLAGAAKDACVGNGVLPDPHILNANLTGLTVTDAIQTYIRYSTYKKTNGTKAQGKGKIFGAATFQAFDATSGFELYSATVWKLPNDLFFTSAGAGVEQDTTGLSACTPISPYSDTAPEYAEGDTFTSATPVDYNSSGRAGSATGVSGGSGACNDVADFSDVFINGEFGIFGFGPGLAAFGHTVEVITTGGGLYANAATVAANNTLQPTSGFSESSLSVYAGQVIG
jgi:hypothetical protein